MLAAAIVAPDSSWTTPSMDAPTCASAGLASKTAAAIATTPMDHSEANELRTQFRRHRVTAPCHKGLG